MNEEQRTPRERTFALLREYPGLHVREVARRANLSEALALYHLDALVALGLLESRSDSGFRRFYPVKGPAPSDADKPLLALLRQPAPLSICLLLLEVPQASHQEITESLGLAKSTVSYHLAKLRDAGVIVVGENGRGLKIADRARVRRVVLRWKPVGQMAARFERIWTALYDRQQAGKRY
jgi:predicted transcriptional regulator